MTTRFTVSAAEAQYRCIATGGVGAERERDLLALRSWLSGLADVDARSGRALPQGWSALCRRAAVLPAPGAAPCDRLRAIVDHVAAALRHVLGQARQRIVRSHAVVPLHAARELDSVSVAWLARQNGRTVREKLAGKPGVMAVRREASLDTLENRLLTAFCRRLEPLLVARCAAFRDTPDEQDLLDRLRRWLREDGAGVRDWANVPPNNVLLQDRHYRKIWDGWMGLQALDAGVERDAACQADDWLELLRWKLVAGLQLAGRVRFPEQPCHVMLDDFGVLPERGALLSGLVRDQNATERAKGKVVSLGQGQAGGFGFIGGPDGRVYFNHRALRSPLDYPALKVGTAVSYALRADGKAAEVEIERSSQGAAVRRFEVQPVTGGFDLTLGDSTLQVRLSLMSAAAGTVRIGKEEFAIHSLSLFAAERIVQRLLAALATKPEPLEVAQTPAQCEPTTAAVVDLSEPWPAWTAGGVGGRLPFRLLRQYWASAVHGEIALDLGDATAMSLCTDAPLLAMSDVIQGRGDAGGRRDEAALAFANRLASFFGKAPLTYLTPDAIDDFALGAARRGLNARFERADPLPRSVAALFDWLGAEHGGKPVAADDYVLVLDHVGEMVTITPLQARRALKLDQRVPQMRGLTWERLDVLEVPNAAAFESLAAGALQRQRCRASDQLCAWSAGPDAQPGTAPSWETKPGEWFTVVSPLEAPTVQKKALQDALVQAKAGIRRGNCVALVLACGTDGLIAPLAAALARDGWPAWPATSLVGGAARLLTWRESAGDEPLWYERLPDLSIRVPAAGRYQRFHLVREGRIEPRRGLHQVIPVDEVFTLPAGQAVLELPLRQGAASEAGKVLAYRLRLASPAFPLRTDVPARLQLEFSYGSDDPYKLCFIPCDPASAGFAAVRATWVAADAEALATQVPGAPPLRSWRELEDHWRSPELALLDQRLSAVYRATEALRNGGYRKEAVRDVVKQVRTQVRRLMLDIWSGGRSVADPDCPAKFAEAIRACAPVLASMNDVLWDDCTTHPHVRDLAVEYMFIVCSLRADLPSEAWPIVRAQVDACFAERRLLDRGRLALACLLGCPDQATQLLQRLVTALEGADPPTQAIVLDLLSIALWRAPALVLMFDAAHVRHVSAALTARLHSVASKIERSGGVSSELAAELRTCLEVLLALLRTRAIPNPAVARLLAVGGPAVSQLAAVLERIEPLVCVPGVQLHPRIAFELDKPAALDATPDLLYLANLYLLGESGVGQIRITGTVDEEGEA